MTIQQMYYTDLTGTLKLLSGSSPAKAQGGSELGEVISIQGSWSLNSIPSMTLTLPMGSNMKTQAKSYVYESTIQNAFANRQPVGVYLKTSKSVPGLFNGTKCLFKGYIDSSSTSYTLGNGTLSLSLRHWLADLNIFSILSRLSSPDNPIDISQDAIFSDKYKEGKVADQTLQGKAWRVGTVYREAMNKGIFEAIKAGLSEAFGETKELVSSDPGYLNKDLYKKASDALKNIESKYLSFRGGGWADLRLQGNIGEYLQNEISSNYYSVTLWQKLIQTLLPSFLLGLIPLVDTAYVVPSPGISMTPEMGRDITESDIVSLQVHKKGPSLLGGVFITADCQAAGDTTYSVKKSNISSYMYPDPPEIGVLKSCTIPGWLALNARGVGVMKKLDKITMTKALATRYALRNEREYATEFKNSSTLYTALCESLVKAIYLSEITASDTATVTTALRLDIVPGDVVCVEVPRDKILELEAEKFYGIVKTVSYNISNGNVGTTYILSHLRTEQLMKKIKQGSHAVLYAQGWRPSGDNSANLYA